MERIHNTAAAIIQVLKTESVLFFYYPARGKPIFPKLARVLFNPFSMSKILINRIEKFTDNKEN
jgi:hypothetical protein